MNISASHFIAFYIKVNIGISHCIPEGLTSDD
jgi:hypothetical protein